VNDVTITGAGAAASFLALRALQLKLQPTILRASLPAVRGIEIIPASAWRLLDALGLGDLLAGLEAGLGDGLTRRLADGTVDARDGRSLVERLKLRKALLREAERRGARIFDIDRLPRLDPDAYAVDATGQRAAWSRPVVRRGCESADIFFAAEAVISPGTGASALLDRGWAYLASDRTSATVGVVGRRGSTSLALDPQIFSALGLADGAPFRHVGRRAAFMQWAARPHPRAAPDDRRRGRASQSDRRPRPRLRVGLSIRRRRRPHDVARRSRGRKGGAKLLRELCRRRGSPTSGVPGRRAAFTRRNA
jgi:hypothetical protein